MNPPILINVAEPGSGWWRHLKWLVKATNWMPPTPGTDLGKVDSAIVIGGNEAGISDAMRRVPPERWKHVVAMLCTGATKFGRTHAWRLARCGAVVVPTEWARQMAAAGNVVVGAEVLRPTLDADVYDAPIAPHRHTDLRFGIYGGVPSRSEAVKQYRSAEMAFAKAFQDEPTIEMLVLARRPPPGSPSSRFSWDNGIVIENPKLRAKWYDRLDGFFSVSAGEGFDFCAEEAFARGVAVAGTGSWGGTGEVGLAVRVPYTLDFMHKRIGSGYFMDNAVGAFMEHDDMVSAWRRLKEVAERRRGTKMVDTERRVCPKEYVSRLVAMVGRVSP